MLASAFAALTLASAAVLPSATPTAVPVPMHFHARPDTRITVILTNPNVLFREVSVGGRSYTVMPHHALSITAPAGTPVYAGSSPAMHRGDLLLALTPELNGKKIPVR